MSLILVNCFFFNIVDEFTDAKIERFGQTLINKIIEVSNRYAIDNKTDDNVNTNKSM